jgi:GNAT superfamily N-acetyltransferase
VRPATAADVPALLELIHSAYRGEASRAGWTTEADLIDGSRTTAELLSADLADPAVTILLAEDATGLLGCCAVTRRTEDTAYFGTFAVRPGAQGAGLGSRLLAAAEEHARAAGAVRMEMTVLAQREELLAWYAKRNYAPTGERRPFPYGDERFGLPRRDDLEFVVLTTRLTSEGA